MNAAALSDPWLAVAVGVFVLAVLAITLLASRERRPVPSTNAKLDALERRMQVSEEKWEKTSHDVNGIKMVVQNLPTKDSISRLTEQVAETRGQIGGMQGTLQSQSRSLDRIEDFLLRVSVEHIVERSRDPGNGEVR